MPRRVRLVAQGVALGFVALLFLLLVWSLVTEEGGDLAAKAADKTGELASKAGDKAGDLAAKASDKAGELAGKAGELAEKARANMPDEVKDAADKVVTQAKNRPWLTAALAAGVLLFWRMLRRKKK